MLKHTQGPWTFVNGNTPRIMTEDGQSIAGVHKKGVQKGTYDPEEVRGNGKILAGSLDAYIALKKLLNYVEENAYDLSGRGFDLEEDDYFFLYEPDSTPVSNGCKMRANKQGFINEYGIECIQCEIIENTENEGV